MLSASLNKKPLPSSLFQTGKTALQLAARGSFVAIVDMIIKADRYYANTRVSTHVYRKALSSNGGIDDHSNISSKTLQQQNFKPLKCMQCGTSHLQTVQENILSHIILATYRKFTVTTVRFTQNVSCNIYTHPIYQQVANVTVIIHHTTKATEYIG